MRMIFMFQQTINFVLNTKWCIKREHGRTNNQGIMVYKYKMVKNERSRHNGVSIQNGKERTIKA